MNEEKIKKMRIISDEDKENAYRIYCDLILACNKISPDFTLYLLERLLCHVFVRRFEDDEVNMFNVLKQFSEKMPEMLKCFLESIKELDKDMKLTRNSTEI